MRAFLKNYRQSPRKVRLVTNLIRGKNVSLALAELEVLPKRASVPIRKLLLSAVANAKLSGANEENLFIKEFQVDKGITMKRMKPVAMGSSHRINKCSSHLNLVLAERVAPIKNSRKTKAVK